MTEATTQPAGAPKLAIGFREFVAMVAAMMAINALGIDMMLPALPDMGHALGIDDPNNRQLIISAYMMGLGIGQLLYGPLADRYGRKPVLLISLALFALTSFAAAFAYDFHTILITRLFQGLASASARVLAISIVRDCYSGRTMARVMSLTFIVFMAVPILAPSIGQIIMLAAPWEGIFVFLGCFAIMLILWTSSRLPETLHPADRREISVAEIGNAARLVLTNRYSFGYTAASTVLFGSLLGFINSVQQIFADIFNAAEWFTIVFAFVAMFMAVAAFVNSRVVEALGTRKVSHTALLAFIVVSTLHVGVVLAGHETLISFALFQAATMFCFGLAGSNFGAMAMEPVGHIAGTASSIQGFLQMICATLIGVAIGQSYDGTTLPVAGGYLVCGVLTLGVVLLVEGGRLFRPRAVPAPQVP